MTKPKVLVYCAAFVVGVAINAAFSLPSIPQAPTPQINTRGIQKSQDGIDALQDERISNLTLAVNETRIDVKAIADAQIKMQVTAESLINTISLIALVFGPLMTGLQIYNAIMLGKRKP